MLPTYVDKEGAIVLGPVCVDGHVDKCVVRVVTHIHQDHLINLDKSIRVCRKVVATIITHELLEELGFSIPKKKRIALNYGEELDEVCDGVSIRLEYAHHIPGSAQVVVETENATYAYSGDFKGVGDKTKPPAGVDVLVVDATYGDPSYKRPPEEVVLDQFVKLLRTLLTQGPVVVYAYYGKAQEVMALLRDYGVDAPFIASPRHWRIAKRLEKYGFAVSDLLLEGTREALEVARDGWFIKFEHFSKIRASHPLNGVSHVILSGWLFDAPIRCVGRNKWIVAFSDHADFDELVHYIELARPRIVVVDSFRGGFVAKRFASYVRNVLRIDAIPSP